MNEEGDDATKGFEKVMLCRRSRLKAGMTEVKTR
jgi:hypothetical protein